MTAKQFVITFLLLVCVFIVYIISVKQYRINKIEKSKADSIANQYAKTLPNSLIIKPIEDTIYVRIHKRTAEKWIYKHIVHTTQGSYNVAIGYQAMKQPNTENQ